MKKTLFLFSLFIAVAMSATAYEKRDLLQKQADINRLKQVLIPNQKWVPYPLYSDREGWDRLSGEHKKELIEKGEKALSFTWVVLKATDYIEFEKSGSRQIMEAPFGANTMALKDLVLAELVEGKGRFTDQIVNGVWFFCEMSTWALSAHLPKRALPDVNQPIIDLTVGDVGSFLSWTYFFLKEPFDKVNPVISRRLRENLQYRVLDPFMERSDFWWQAFDLKPGAMVNNWNPWCNFNVLSSFLLLENDPEKLAAAVHRTMISTDEFINYNHEDGACEEGPSYWGHAAGKLYDYLELLLHGTGGKVSVFDKQIIKNLGEYIAKSYIGNGWVVNFADASAKGGGYPGLIYRYGKAVNSEVMTGFAGYLAEKQKRNWHVDGGRDVFRTFENLRTFEEVNAAKPALFTGRYTWYPQTEFCYMRQGNLFFAAKGGYNAESHNHNDVGSFILYHKNTPVLIDAGVGTYTRQTFSNERYTIWTMQSEFHSLPLINGSGQSSGKDFRSQNARFNPQTSEFSLDIAGAYSKTTNAKSWVRSYTMQGDGKRLLVRDAFELSEVDAKNEIIFMSAINPNEVGKGVLVLGDLKLKYDPGVFDFKVEAVPQIDKRLSSVWGDNLYRIRFTTRKESKKGVYGFTFEE